MKNKELYNKIISNVAKEVRKAINEKAGVIEFNNIDYRKEICKIAKTITQPAEYNDSLNIGDSIIEGVKKYTFNLSSLSWIDSIHVYYKFDRFSPFAAMAFLNDDESVKLGLFKADKSGHIQFGTIYISDNGTENIAHVLFHEMCHLYDSSKFKQIWMNDLGYYLDEHDYDINLYNYYDDVSIYSCEDIHNVITESMRFSNFTESHAFMENINFEMFEHLNKFNFNFERYHNIEHIFMRSSRMLYDIYCLEKIVGNLRHISSSMKDNYMSIYREDINNAYYGFNTFDKMVNYIYKKLHKIVSHSRALFNYYYNLDSEAKRVYELDESEKRKIYYTIYTGGSKRKRALLELRKSIMETDDIGYEK